MSEHLCPTCGCVCEVVSDRDGTSHYRPSDAGLRERLAQAERDLADANEAVQVLGMRLAQAERQRDEACHLGAESAMRHERDLAAERVTVHNLQQALIAAGHVEDCPVVAGASMDCVPGGGCVDLAASGEEAQDAT